MRSPVILLYVKTSTDSCTKMRMNATICEYLYLLTNSYDVYTFSANHENVKWHVKRARISLIIILKVGQKCMEPYSHEG